MVCFISEIFKFCVSGDSSIVRYGSGTTQQLRNATMGWWGLMFCCEGWVGFYSLPNLRHGCILYIFYFSAKSDTYIRYFPHDVIYTIVDQKSSFVIICLKDAPSLAF